MPAIDMPPLSNAWNPMTVDELAVEEAAAAREMEAEQVSSTRSTPESIIHTTQSSHFFRNTIRSQQGGTMCGCNQSGMHAVGRNMLKIQSGSAPSGTA